MSFDIKVFYRKVVAHDLDKPIWLKRDSLLNVISDLVFKGDFQNKLIFGRTHWILMIQAGLGTFFVVSGLLVIAVGLNLLNPNFFVIELKEISLAASFPAALVSLLAYYWNVVKRYGDQWTYCANVFNKIFYEKFPEKVDDKALLSHLYRRTLFAIDLLDCNLYSHKSFWSEFNLALENAMIFSSKNIELSGNSNFSLASSNGMKISDSRKLLSQYLIHLETEMLK